MSIYLETLTRRLTTAMGNLPEDVRQRHGEYLRSTQNADGGFPDRGGDSDLYYTGFALRSLALVDSLNDPVAERAAAYLKQQMQGKAAIIDFLSLLYSALLLQTSAGVDLFEEVDDAWRESVADTLEGFRRDDGGYARTHQTNVGSTYNSFLVVLCQQLIGWPVQDAQRLAEFVRSRVREDGGFVEIPAMKRSGTNPTSAAVALLRILEALDEDLADGAIDYLLERQSSEGGLTANTRIPVADTLSTFTGMLTLADLAAVDELDLPAVRRFVESMEQPAGGFRGAVLDEACDVEYTFYGLGCLALLAEQGA